MNLDMLGRGFALGFSIAAPVGPIGVLCIRRTLAEGRVAGLLSGLGAATADAVYGALAALSLTLITNVLVGISGWLRLLGGLYLLYLALHIFRAAPVTGVALRGRGWLSAYASTFALTLANPMTIMSFVAIFAGLGVEAGGAARELVAGVFGGSALWWLLLSGSIGCVRERLSAAALRWINCGSGAIVLGFGLIALFSLL